MPETQLAMVKNSDDRFIHPWLRDVQGVPPCALQLIASLTLITSASYHSPFTGPGYPQIISPLASQPVVERSLQIAGYLHTKYGRDRSVARQAFASKLPTAVLTRKGKGGPDGWMRELVNRNRAFLKEVFLDGILVREHILDPKKIESLLALDVSKSAARVNSVIVHLYIESWARRWMAAGGPDTTKFAESVVRQQLTAC